MELRLLGPPDARPAVLTPDEAARHAAFGHADRRLGFVLGRTAARGLLAERLGCAPEAVPLVVAAGGAPDVPRSDVWVSIAHTGRGEAVRGGAAIADRKVGLDLELVRPRRPDLWRRLLRPDEDGVLDAVGGPSDSGQTALWTLKEAVLKARGTGFRAGARSVRLVGLDDGDGEAVDDDGGRWRVRYERRGDLWVAVALAA